LEPQTIEQRAVWFSQFASTGRYRLLVAEENNLIVGYAGTTRFRPKPAYDTTVEATIYCAADVVGRGIGRQLYAALFAALAQEDVHRIVAGYVPPNPAQRRSMHVLASGRSAYSQRTAANWAGTGMFAGLNEN
jgi:phosphinothricin acetyltransferase